MAVKTYSDVIDKWPSQVELADDLAEKVTTVGKWRQRNRIPSRHWVPLVAAARRRGIPIDETTLAKIAHRNSA